MRAQLEPQAQRDGDPATPSSLAELVNGYLAAQLLAVQRGDRRLRGADLGAIHATRVAVRRYRTVLRVFDGLLAPGAESLDRELAWYADLLGAVRDLDVTRARLAITMPDQLAELFTAELESRAAQARTTLARNLAGPRADALRTELPRYTHAMPCSARQAPVAEIGRFLDAQQRRARARLRRARQGGLDTDRWHRARKQVKRTRYTAELAEPVLGAPARRLAHDAKAIQDELGTIQDTVVLLDLIDSGTVAAAAAGPVGALRAQQERVLHEGLARAARLRL